MFTILKIFARSTVATERGSGRGVHASKDGCGSTNIYYINKTNHRRRCTSMVIGYLSSVIPLNPHEFQLN